MPSVLRTNLHHLGFSHKLSHGRRYRPSAPAVFRFPCKSLCIIVRKENVRVRSLLLIGTTTAINRKVQTTGLTGNVAEQEFRRGLMVLLQTRFSGCHLRTAFFRLSRLCDGSSIVSHRYMTSYKPPPPNKFPARAMTYRSLRRRTFVVQFTWFPFFPSHEFTAKLYLMFVFFLFVFFQLPFLVVLYSLFQVICCL